MDASRQIPTANQDNRKGAKDAKKNKRLTEKTRHAIKKRKNCQHPQQIDLKINSLAFFASLR
jgi:hypothetical protein